MLRWSSLLLALAIALLVTSAHARDATSDAKQAFRAGEAAFERDDYPTALAEFKRAFELAPRAAVRFNIGVCLERMGRFKEARAEYRAALASGELDRSARERAAADAARVEGKLASVVVEGKPAGASVSIDGERVCSALPCRAEVDPGKHQVVVRAQREQRQLVNLASGERRTLEIDLGAPPPAPERRTPPSEREREPEPPGTGPGVLTWVGGGLALAGTAGAVGFGLRARDLQRDYDEQPSRDTRDEGLRMVTYTNVSIGVAVVGAALVVVDLFVLAPSRARTGQRLQPVIAF